MIDDLQKENLWVEIAWNDEGSESENGRNGPCNPDFGGEKGGGQAILILEKIETWSGSW